MKLRVVIALFTTAAFLSLAACSQTPDSASLNDLTVTDAPTDLMPADPEADQLQAQDFGTALSDVGNDVAANATGVYVAGYTGGSLDGVNKGSTDAFVRRYDANGMVWGQQFGTRSYDFANSVAVDGAGNSYVAGETNGALGFKLGVTDGFLRKYNSLGVALWTRQFGSKYRDTVEDMALDRSGNIFVLGRDDRDRGGVVVRKYSASGVLLGRRAAVGANLSQLSPASLAIDSLGNVIVLAGWSGGSPRVNQMQLIKLTNALADVWSVTPYQPGATVIGTDIATFGTDIYVTLFNQGALLFKLNSLGKLTLAQVLEPTTCVCTTPAAVSTDTSGNVYVTGYTSGAFPGFTNAGSEDIVAFKYNGALARLWVRQLGAGTNGSPAGDYGRAMAISDSVYVTGSSFGNLLGDPKYGAAGDYDAYLLRLDKTTGEVLGIDQ
jgi:Beta-propeller repeat